MKNKYNIPDVGFTHGGKFHSDDVFSAALLKYMNPDIKIIRGFVVPENFEGIVFDIGLGEFDHHQNDRRVRENGIPYAAFGLLWNKYGADIIGEEEALEYDRKFIEDMDLSDNTGSDNELCYIISEFNPSWDSEESFDEAFEKAVDVAYTILTNHFNSIFGMIRAKDMVCKAMEESDGTILQLSKHAPWKKYVKGSTYLFVVYPSQRGGYSAQCVEDEDTKDLICPFPEEWRGKSSEELSTISGIATLRFCHNSGFLIAADTKEDVILACLETIRINKTY